VATQPSSNPADTLRRIGDWASIGRQSISLAPTLPSGLPWERIRSEIQVPMKKSEWEANGKAMDTNTGESPDQQSQSQWPGHSPACSYEEMGHWTPSGAEPMVIRMECEKL